MGRQWISNHIRKRDANIMMNSREKAIESYYVIQDVCAEHKQYLTDEEKAKHCKVIFDYLAHPTLDDAIKVVEEELSELLVWKS